MSLHAETLLIVPDQSASELFASQIRRARQELRLSQEELAERSGLHRTYISGLERQTRNPSLQVIERLSAALGKEPFELLRPLDPSSAKSERTASPVSEAEDRRVECSNRSSVDETELRLRAAALRSRREKDLLKRERLAPCIKLVQQKTEELRKSGEDDPERAVLAYLTDILRATYPTVLKQIARSGKTGIAAQNAVKRSAGTNFQGMCEYALLRWISANTPILCIGTNSPRALRDELTIHGVDGGQPFNVEPDIDICIWPSTADNDTESPLLFISAKSSLVDRAGQAARWKLYLDLHQTTCPHTKDVSDCPIHKTAVTMGTHRPIQHCLVTANIYKIDTTQPEGELGSAQCLNNTYMFQHRFTTRNDETEFRPDGWRSLTDIVPIIRDLFDC